MLTAVILPTDVLDWFQSTVRQINKKTNESEDSSQHKKMTPTIYLFL